MKRIRPHHQILHDTEKRRDGRGKTNFFGEHGPDSHTQQVAKHEGHHINHEQYGHVNHPTGHEFFHVRSRQHQPSTTLVTVMQLVESKGGTDAQQYCTNSRT